MARMNTFLAVLLSLAFAPAVLPQEHHDELPPLRELAREKTHELRTLYLEDPRLPTLSADERRELYARIEKLARDWYGFDVRLKDLGSRPLEEFFKKHEPTFLEFKEGIEGMAIDIRSPDSEKRLRETIARDFEGRELSQILRYVGGRKASKAKLVDRALKRFRARLREMLDAPMADGEPFQRAGEGHANSYPHWTTVQFAETQADFLVTNTMIAGADAGMPIYVIARGGVTTGNTNNNPHNAFQGTTMVGLFPFLSDAPYLLRERGALAAGERLDVAASFCMHELGHLLLRYAEHYDHPNCVHVAPKGLDYLAWHREVRAQGPCRLEHRKLERY